MRGAQSDEELLDELLDDVLDELLDEPAAALVVLLDDALVLLDDELVALLEPRASVL